MTELFSLFSLHCVSVSWDDGNGATACKKGALCHWVSHVLTELLDIVLLDESICFIHRDIANEFMLEIRSATVSSRSMRSIQKGLEWLMTDRSVKGCLSSVETQCQRACLLRCTELGKCKLNCFGLILWSQRLDNRHCRASSSGRLSSRERCPLDERDSRLAETASRDEEIKWCIWCDFWKLEVNRPTDIDQNISVDSVNGFLTRRISLWLDWTMMRLYSWPWWHAGHAGHACLGSVELCVWVGSW